MSQFIQIAKLLGGSRDGAAAPRTIQPLVYEPEALTYFTALTNSGLTLSDARKYTLNRAVKRFKALGSDKQISYGYAMSADAFAIDMFNRVTVTKVGTPTFSALAVSTAANTNYYELNVQFKDIVSTDHSMGFLATAGSAANANSDMGVTDGSIRLAINSKVTTTNLFSAGSFTAPVGLGSTAQAAGSGFNAISRHPSTPGTFYNYTGGIMRASSATAAGTTVSTNKLRILMLGGGSTVSSRSMSSWFYAKGLTHAEMVEVYAIMRSIDNAIRYGEPYIEDSGYGTAIVEADVVVVGLSVAAINAAYQATREGLVAVLVGEERDTSPEHIGFIPVAWVDAHDPLTVNGLCRAIITAANTQAGTTDTSNQQGLSVHAMRWNRFARQMLDTTRTGGTLPGADIKVYFSAGIDEMSMATTAIGRECTEIRTKDGRIFRPLNSRMIVVNGDYDGNILPLLGVSYIKGTEAQGSAPGEDLNGFDPTALFPLRDSDGAAYNAVDPYIVEGNAASGLLPNIIEMPSIVAGSPDPTLQAMCYRLITTSNAARMAPLTGGATLQAPNNYSALTYEPLARLFTAYVANAHTPGIEDCYAIGHTIEGSAGSVQDWNNGGSGFSLDMGQLAGDYLAATSRSQRDATIQRLTEYTQGYAYWILNSGDPRIPAGLITAVAGWGLDTIWGVDPYPGHPLFFPPYPYKRDPVHQMKNTFDFSGHDTFAVDGTTPRSIKTVACGSYRADKHTTRWVVSGGFLVRQGGVNDTTAGGTNERIPVPLECIVPDKTECANFISVTSLACTKIANASLRMEPVYQLCGQASGIIAAHALTDAVAVQDIDYTAFRTSFLAIPDAVAPVIPQTN